MRVVLDASVAAKWLVPEPDTEKARRVLVDWKEGRIELVAPSVLLVEVASVLWKKVKKNELHSGDAAGLFREFRHLGLPLVAIEGLIFHALDFSFFYKHPVYDCIYVALAVRERCSLLTADEELFQRISKPVPRMVRLLRDWEP
jgi:predicted nucleic acid-binding protein